MTYLLTNIVYLVLTELPTGHVSKQKHGIPIRVSCNNSYMFVDQVSNYIGRVTYMFPV